MPHGETPYHEVNILKGIYFKFIDKDMDMKKLRIKSHFSSKL